MKRGVLRLLRSYSACLQLPGVGDGEGAWLHWECVCACVCVYIYRPERFYLCILLIGEGDPSALTL